MTRPNGHYWVGLGDKTHVAHFNGKTWAVPGSDWCFYEADFTWIGNHLLLPPKSKRG